MNLHAAAAYMMHMLRARSTAGHGVHSPFMYRFITEVLGATTDSAIKHEVESLRREMLADRRIVKVRDLGAGSSVMRREERRIRQIASAAALPARDAALLARIAGNLDMICMRERRGEMPADSGIGQRQQHHQEIGPGPQHHQEFGQGQQHHQEFGPGPQHHQEFGQGRQHHQEFGPGPQHHQEFGPGLQHGQEIGTGHWQGQEMGGQHRPESGRGKRHLSDRETGAGQQPAGRNRPDLPAEAENLSGPVILELGTSLGISTLALALAAPDRKVISLEGCPELAAIAGENLRKHGAINADVICMEFSEALSHLTSLGTKVELAFIDGNHRGSALEKYVKTIREMGDEMIIVADDIRMNMDMSSIWQTLAGEIRSHPSRATTATHGEQQTQTDILSYTLRGSATLKPGESENLLLINPQATPVSLETFRLGMLFFLRNLTPGHYRVRC